MKKNNLCPGHYAAALLLVAGIVLMGSCKKNTAAPPPPVPLVVTSFTPAAGAKDSIVVIKGKGFSSTVSKDTVLFNNKRAVIVAATDTTLTVRVPRGVAEHILGVGTATGENVAFISVTVGRQSVSPANNFQYIYTAGTLAGDGHPGLINATGTAAEFNAPSGVAVDASGNVYVADAGNNSIRKISSAGVVSTLAGDITPGFINAVGTAARFNAPGGIAVDASGNVYVADAGNHSIRKITPGGQVSTLAGDGTPGFVEATGTAARFNTPGSLAVDALGNVYVADNGNLRIRKIAPDGSVSTLAGNGAQGFRDTAARYAMFSSYIGIASTQGTGGTLFIADAGNNRFRVFLKANSNVNDSTYNVQTFGGNNTPGATDGVGTLGADYARFNYPQGIATDIHGSNTDYIIADTHNNSIRKFTISGGASTLAGNGAPDFANGVGNAARFNAPVAVAVDAEGRIYVADRANHRIRVVQ